MLSTINRYTAVLETMIKSKNVGLIGVTTQHGQLMPYALQSSEFSNKTNEITGFYLLYNNNNVPTLKGGSFLTQNKLNIFEMLGIPLMKGITTTYTLNALAESNKKDVEGLLSLAKTGNSMLSAMTSNWSTSDYNMKGTKVGKEWNNSILNAIDLALKHGIDNIMFDTRTRTFYIKMGTNVINRYHYDKRKNTIQLSRYAIEANNMQIKVQDFTPIQTTTTNIDELITLILRGETEFLMKTPNKMYSVNYLIR